MDNKITYLINKYMDGDTTHAEELELRKYFRTTPNIPEEWKPLKALFLFVDVESTPVVSLNTQAPTHKKHLRRWWAYASAAAILMALVVMTFSRNTSPDCFAVINGKTIINEAQVQAEAEQALQLVSITDEDAFGALSQLEMAE